MKSTIIILAILCPFLSMCQPITLQGKVIDGEGSPVAGATVTLVKTTDYGRQTTGGKTIDDGPQTMGEKAIALNKMITISDKSGEWKLENGYLGDTVIVSAIGYETSIELVNERGLITTTLRRKVTALDEALVIAYGQTTRRFSTGNVSKVAAKDIALQPVTDPLAALAGRVPGLLISQTNGMPGSSIRIQLRGPGSLRQGSDPLFIIDGVPFAPNNDPLNQLTSAAAPTSSEGLSPFATIDPSTIESIEVLKDADATAIYGSRGANGVILITTQKAKVGKTRFSFNVSTAFSRATKMMPLLTTPEYITMRKEAFANDGVVPTISTAPDLLVWDTTRYTDFNDLILGGTARRQQVNGDVSGGTIYTRFSLSGGYLREGTILPGNLSNQRGNARLFLYHQLPSKKLSLQVTVAYSSGTNRILSNTMLNALRLSPNAPALYDSEGQLNWQDGGVSFSNPMAELLRSYKASNATFNSSVSGSYEINRFLHFKFSGGYNTVSLGEYSLNPKAAFNPISSPTASSSSSIASNQFSNWLVEPQLEYQQRIRRTQLLGLIGASWQSSRNEGNRINATGFANDALLLSPGAASSITASTSFSEYRYQALFGRFTYTLRDRYIINVSGRFDGSSRFGPGKQFAGFGAAGLAWILSEEAWMKPLRWISFAKLRGSYGVTGNDQVGNYQYLDSWTSTLAYQNSPALIPSRLYNPDYSWERNRKFELGADLGFLNDRILFSAAWFRQRSNNQLINYALPGQTGFQVVVKNFPALLENQGWEFTLSAKTNLSKVRYQFGANLTLHRNTLLSFPGLEQSSYASTYVVGQPVNLVRNYRYVAVNPATGVYVFEDTNGDGVLSSKDYQINGHRNPPFYGGIHNSIEYGDWSIDLFIEFRKQQGANYLSAITSVPGTMINQPAIVLQRWRHPGDVTAVQQFSTTASSAAYKAMTLLRNSNAAFSDASFIRGKNLSIAWNCPASLLQRMHAQGLKVYCSVQNLFTISSYAGGDPENLNLNAIPLLRTIAAGIQLNF